MTYLGNNKKIFYKEGKKKREELTIYLLLNCVLKTFTFYSHISSSTGFPRGSAGKEPAMREPAMRETWFNPRVGRIPWKRAWHPLQYSCLENPHDGTWWATVHGVAKNQTRLSKEQQQALAHSKISIKFLLSHLYSAFVSSASSKISSWVQHLQTFINTALITLYS